MFEEAAAHERYAGPLWDAACDCGPCAVRRRSRRLDERQAYELHLAAWLAYYTYIRARARSCGGWADGFVHMQIQSSCDGGGGGCAAAHHVDDLWF